ncbi:MAG: nucleoside recognition domain-containing protein [Bacteroidales bacterium]
MVLNYIWIAFFLIAFVTGLIKLIVFGDFAVFPDMGLSIISSAKTGFEISIGLTGVLSFWLGIMKIGEKGGIVKIFSRVIGPFFSKLFPGLPKDHPAIGSIMLNFSANMLGLENAATPMGLKAMEQMHSVNDKKDTASNAQIMFLVINTAGFTLIPISVMVYRAQLGAADPSDVFIPILLATTFSTIAGIISVALYQKINLLNRVVLSYFAVIGCIIAGIIYYLSNIPKEQISEVSKQASNIIILLIITSFILLAFRKKENVYDAFIEGAKEGFHTAIKIIPFLIAVLVAIGVFRSSGAMDYLINGLTVVFKSVGINTDFVPSLPVALMKPLSGSGARTLMIDTLKTYGADSFIGRVSSIVQGSADTTFYILALYFGSVGIKNTRYALVCGLIADFAGITAAILIGYLFFH